MTDIFIDRTRHTSAYRASDWGDLLTALDADLDARGVVVTAVRFDGVDQPTFRHPSATTRDLNTIRQVHLETARPEVLLRQCLADAADAVGHMGGQVDRIATLFRRRELQLANQGLAQLAADLGAFVALVDTLRGPIGLDAACLAIDGASVEVQIARLHSRLESLLEAQRQEDWLTIGDILEYDLAPTLRAWRERLEELAIRVHPLTAVE